MAKKKIDDDGTEDIKDSVDRDVAAVKAGIEDKAEDSGGKERREFAVDKDDEDDDGDIDDEINVRPSRRERRAERGRSLVQDANYRAELAERRALEAERKAEEALRAIQQQQAPKPEAQPDASKELDSVYEDQQLLYSAYQAAKSRPGGITEKEQADFERRGREVRAREIRALLKAEGGGQPSAPTVTAEEVIRQVRRSEIVQEHNDVLSHPRAYRWAHAAMAMAVEDGKDDTRETLREVMNRARRKFGIGNTRPDPTDADRRRLGGISRGGGGSRESGVRTIIPTDAERRMADKMYAHLPKGQRLAKWAKEVGKELVEEGRRD